MSSDFESRLAAAQTPLERSWFATEYLLDILPSELLATVWTVAIPHWFDETIIAALRPELRERAKELYVELQSLPFVEAFADRGQNVLELTRKAILDKFWHQNPDEFRDISRRAAQYFSSFDKTESTIEWLYHLVVAEPDTAPDLLMKTAEEWNNSFRFGELESLATSLMEQASSGRVSGRICALIYYWQGKAALRAHRINDALDSFIKSSHEAGSDREILAKALLAIGDVLKYLSRDREALERYRAALKLFREVKDARGEANSLKAVGDVLLIQDRKRSALTEYNEALGLYRKLTDRIGEAYTLKGKGDALCSLNREEEGLECYYGALILYRDLRDRFGVANTLKAIGDVLLSRNENRDARASYKEACELYESAGSNLGLANTFMSLGNEASTRNDFVAALNYYERAFKLYQQVRIPISQSDSLLRSALANIQLGRKKDAMDCLGRSAHIANQIRHRELRSQALDEYEKLSSNQGDYSDLRKLVDSLLDGRPDDGDLLRLRKRLLSPPT